jgi:hypothetical protein
VYRSPEKIVAMLRVVDCAPEGSMKLSVCQIDCE